MGIATMNDRLKIIKREEETCPCGRIKRSYTVEKKCGRVVKTTLHKCSFEDSIGLDGRPIGQAKMMRGI